MSSTQNWYIWTPCKDCNGIVIFYEIVGWGVEIADQVAFCRRLDRGAALTKEEYPVVSTAIWEEWTPLTDCPTTNLPIVVCSSRLKNILDQMGLGTSIQWLPIEMVGGETHSRVGTYYLLNCLKIIPCATRSDQIKSPCPSSNDERIIKKHIRKSLSTRADLGNCLLFRIREHDDYIIVHCSVKQAMEQSEVTGCCFEAL